MNPSGGTIFSRRHYAGYRPTETISLRAGRFGVAYGLNIPDHFVSIKRGLRWDEGSEAYNIEAAWLGESADLFVTGTVGRPDAPALNRDKGLALRSSIFLSDRFKLGWSYLYGASGFGGRHVTGPYAILGFSPRFFVLAELDFQRFAPAAGGDAQWGVVNYVKVDYEVLKGVHGYVTQEYAKLDLRNVRSEMASFGVGVQFFPRPHLEINGSYQKQRVRAVSKDFADFAWLLLHYYL